MAKVKPAVSESEKPATFTKQQLLKSKKYTEKKDLINALLVDDRSYSMAEVEEILNNFLKGKVI
ncbi:hypothetical protein [Anaerocolumna sp.]|uniref:hypothetical protein n=1 Tax=Anaerocolumna sp. TaxID=2041569 RepID=UPI0028AA2313|nr:hypothetical protein [Anaerocolumna sp.]